MAQTWHDLLFAHWPIAAEILRPLVPAELPLDTFDDSSWLAIAPFRMSSIRGRLQPPIPGLSTFPELNVRTYVIIDGKPGVFFFSLDAASSVAVWTARTFYRLPYFQAEMSVQISGEEISYSSKRHNANAEFKARYQPVAAVQLRAKGTLEHWLTERYCLYTAVSGSVYRAEIHHQPWPLQNAEANFVVNTMASAAGVSLPQVPPLLHFSRRLEVLIWPLRRLS